MTSSRSTAGRHESASPRPRTGVGGGNLVFPVWVQTDARLPQLIPVERHRPVVPVMEDLMEDLRDILLSRTWRFGGIQRGKRGLGEGDASVGEEELGEGVDPREDEKGGRQDNDEEQTGS